MSTATPLIERRQICLFNADGKPLFPTQFIQDRRRCEVEELLEALQTRRLVEEVRDPKSAVK